MDENTDPATPKLAQIKDNLQHPTKRRNNFDKEQSDLEKRKRIGAGALATMHRKQQEEASLFATNMFTRSGSTRKTVAAKEVFNDNSAANTQRETRVAQSVAPAKPDSVDPEVLTKHIDAMTELNVKQEKVSYLSVCGVVTP